MEEQIAVGSVDYQSNKKSVPPEQTQHSKRQDQRRYGLMNQAVDTLQTMDGTELVLQNSSDISRSTQLNVQNRVPLSQGDEEELSQKYDAHAAIKLIVPVSLCILIVVITLNVVSSYSTSKNYSLYTPFHEVSPHASVKFWNALANSMILMSIVVVMTIALIVLYKKRCYKTLHSWLILSSFVLLFIFSYFFLEELLHACNMPLDYPTALLIVWNFGVVGMLTMHWQGPIRLQQCYLVFVAAQMALLFIKYLPEWTAWSALFLICVWDLFAVLTPKGPLRILVETAQKRNDQMIPAVIYSATVLYAHMSVDSSDSAASSTSSNYSSSDAQHFRRKASAAGPFVPFKTHDHEVQADFTEQNETILVDNAQVGNEQNSESCTEYRKSGFMQTDAQVERSIKLGLGDFVFYSVLVGKASSFGDWTITVACFIAILIGLCLTLFLLTIRQKALPALPISITFGLIFHLATIAVIKPFIEHFMIKQIFI